MREFDCRACKLSFATRKELVKHKVESDRHEYCKRCDEDFDNEDVLLVHKIVSQRHIACHVCGVDFKSESGRDAHFRQMHRAEQKIVCSGCSATFTRAAGLIAHIELSSCPVISAELYAEARQKKDVLKEAIERSLAERGKEGAAGGMLLDISGAMRDLSLSANPNAGGGAGTLARGTASPASAMSADHLRDESSSNGLMSGGVSLRGALTPSNCSGSRRGNPPADLITGDDDDLDSAMSMIPAQTPSSSSTGSQWPTSLKPEVQSASPMQPWPLVRSPAAPDSGPTAPTPTTMTKLAPQGSWAKGAPRMAATTTAAHSTAHGSDHAKRVSKAPVTPTIPAPHNAKGHGSERAPGGTDDRSTSLRTQSLVSSVPRWDSSTAAPAPLASNMALARLSSQWDPQRFWNDMLGQFICACQKTFNTADELEDHVRGEEHSAGPFRCPGCLRLFKSITALVSHCESASVRCSISRSENYSRILNDLSAGVLDTDGYNRDGSIKYKARPFDPNSVQW